MLEEFSSSWSLFYWSFLAGWLACLCLSLCGVIVIAKRQVFLGAALSQSAILGIALSLVLEVSDLTGIDNEIISHSFAVLVALGGAWIIFFLARRYRAQAEISALVFLTSASGAILLVSKSPHGTEEVHAMTASSLIGATPLDVFILAIAFLVLLSLGIWKKRELGLFLIDYETAGAVGIPVEKWDFVCAIVIGLVVGFCLKVAGFLFTFGFLIIPLLTAREISKSIGILPLVSMILGFLVCTISFLLSISYDFPPAQVAVFLLCLLWFLAMAWRKIML